MAQIKNLSNLSKSNTTNSHYVYVQNTATTSDFKFQLNSIFPTISDVGSAGVKSHNNFSNTTQLNLRKIAATSTSSGALTSTLHGDGHILLSLVEASLDLNNCDNSTSAFLSTVNLASNVGATILPVANGGTGAATLTANGLLVGNGTSAVTAVDLSTKGSIVVGDGIGNPSAVAVGTNDFVLTADSTTASGVAWKAVTIGSALSATLDTDNNNIDLGTGFINGDGANNKGLSFNSSGQVFIGSGTPSLSQALNINGNIALTDDTTMEPVSQASGNGKTLKIHAGGASAGSGAALVLKGGDSTGGGGNGGAVTIQGGEKEGGGTSGNITLSPVNDTNTGVTTGLVADALIVDPNLDATMRYGNMVFGTPTKGLVYTSRADVTQLTDHSTSVTSNGTAGIITLAAVSLASGAEAEFRVVNSAAQRDSLILLTVESVAIGSTTDDSVIIAQIAGKADGNFDVALKNVGDAATDTNARKVHYLIVNNSV